MLRVLPDLLRVSGMSIAPLYVNGRYQGARLTGVQRYAREIVTGLGDRARLIAPQGAAQGVRGQIWEQWKLPGLVPKDAWLFSPCNTTPLSWKRQLATIHDAAFVDTPQVYSWSFRKWYQWLMPRVARRATKLFTVSDFSRQRLAEVCKVPIEKFVLTYCGADERFRPCAPEEIDGARKKYDLPPRYILSVGSLEPRKNLKQVLKAWGTLTKWHGDVTLVLAGGQGKSQVFGNPDLAPIPPATKFLGFIDDEWLAPLYAGAEAFLFASAYEGFGIPTIEAMRCGTPAICSSTTAFPEIAGDAAEYVDPTSIDSIAHGVDRVLSDADLRARLRNAGFERAPRYTWTKSAEVVYKTYQEVASDGR